jgi:acetoacetyl-CoA synthetase
MWNFLQATMLLGGVPVLYDGSPGYPSLDVLWQFAEELPIHHFGTSAPFLTACMQKNLKLNQKYNLSQLRSIGSTGSPLPPETFDYIYEHISKDVWLCSMSGGTDVCTAFVGGHPYKKVYKGLIQSRALGCALKAYNENGEEVTGELGEMIIEKPMPSMPIYFWNDQDNIRYKKSYFDLYENKWRHGDWIMIQDDGSLIIQGRSDSTLNRKGVRIGTAEIYNVLDKISDIKDALIINIELKDGSDRMPLFIVLNESSKMNDTLKSKINQTLKSHCSPRHVPDEIYEVTDIPYTLSGKKMEVPVKKIFMNINREGNVNREAMRNPDSIDDYINIAKNFLSE